MKTIFEVAVVAFPAASVAALVRFPAHDLRLLHGGLTRIVPGMHQRRPRSPARKKLKSVVISRKPTLRLDVKFVDFARDYGSVTGPSDLFPKIQLA